MKVLVFIEGNSRRGVDRIIRFLSKEGADADHGSRIETRLYFEAEWAKAVYLLEEVRHRFPKSYVQGHTEPLKVKCKVVR